MGGSLLSMDQARSPLLAACAGTNAGPIPVWFMRQAGRSLPEYRKLRSKGSILDAVRDPELAAELTLQPVRRYGVDAAILFSDIMVPIAATGFGVEIMPGVGPVAEQPLRSEQDLARLRPFEVSEDAPWLEETVRILVRELDVPLIGFAGGPFTVASYLIEGAPSRDHLQTKFMMANNPSLWDQLLDRLADQAISSLRAQAEAGCAALQLFDSWVGALDPHSFRKQVLPATSRVLEETADLGVPRIVFGVGTGELLAHFAEAGADVVGVDWRVPLSRARNRVGPRVALQGNLDPAAPAAGWDATRKAAAVVLAEAEAAGLDRYVFNLGHGVLPSTDPAVLEMLVGMVHSYQPGGRYDLLAC